MSWSDLDRLKQDLSIALTAYDWQTAGTVCDALVRMVWSEPSPCPTDQANAILGSLRAKRRFELVMRVAEAFLASGQDDAKVRRQYAQALIDSGWLTAAQPILEALAAGSFEGQSQVAEAHGLLGRLFKQRYVNADRAGSQYARVAFERSLSEYLQIYRLNPAENYWHGVNVVALLNRGQFDYISITHAPNADVLAREIVETLRTTKDPSPFVLATRAEAFLALKDTRNAQEALLAYSQHLQTDAFEAASTLRQFEEVWRLRDDVPPGDTLLPILRAARLRGERGALQLTPAQVDQEIKKVKEAQTKLEGNFGDDRTQTLQWYLDGLLRTKSVARIEALNGRGVGTGWLVPASEFFKDRKDLLLLTNAHVIGDQQSGKALLPGDAVANFQGLKQMLQIDQIVWTSPVPKLDATFVTVKGDLAADLAIPIQPKPVDLEVPGQRVYIMGYPGGRDLEFSLHDNRLVACVDRFLHYRTPTEGGNSGSPVFEHLGWRAIALHHAGEPTAAADGHRFPYEANEGIALTALQAATRA